MKEIRIIHFRDSPVELHFSRITRSTSGPAAGPYRFRLSDFNAHYVVAGHLYSGTPFRETAIGPGEIAFGFPNTKACTGASQGHDLYHWHFDFGSMPIHKITTSLEEWARIVLESTNLSGYFANTFIIPDRLKIGRNEEVCGLLETIMRAQRSAAPGSNMAAMASLLLLLQRVTERTLTLLLGKGDAKQKSRCGVHLSRAMSFVESNISERLSPRQIARALRLNSDYLSRIFKGSMGEGLGTYICKRKMSMARDLLLDSNLNIKEIARCCGFSDALYFSRYFRKVHAMSPTEYILRNSQIPWRVNTKAQSRADDTSPMQERDNSRA